MKIINENLFNKYMAEFTTLPLESQTYKSYLLSLSLSTKKEEESKEIEEELTNLNY